MIYFQHVQQVGLSEMGTHFVQLEVKGYALGDGFAIEQCLVLDGGFHKTIKLDTYTRDQFLDVYELAHHQLHGRDPRGLDPREGPTRLHPGPVR